MSDSKFPKCFGSFMKQRAKDCSNCSYLKECYKAWKEKGEPGVTLECGMKEESKCNCSI